MQMDDLACRLDMCYVHQSVFEQRFLKSLVTCKRLGMLISKAVRKVGKLDFFLSLS